MARRDHVAMAAGASAAAGHGNSHSMSGMNMRDKSLVPDSVKVGVGVDAIAMSPIDRTGDPGVGLEDVGHKVLTYRDLMRSEEHTSELQSLMRTSYAVFCLKKKKKTNT